MADASGTTVNSDFFVDDVKTAVKATKQWKKRPETKLIWQYISDKFSSNIDEGCTGEILKYLFSEKILVNKRKAKGISYETVSENQNEIENEVTVSDAEP